MIFFLSFLLILVGLYGVLAQRNIVKIVISLLIIEYGIHLFLMLQGYRSGGVAPILDAHGDRATWLNQAVDPLPQALVLTSIVIGLGVLAMMIALCSKLHQRYGTFDITRIKKVKG